jgi:hypothetical protein
MPTPPECHGPMVRHHLNTNLRVRKDGVWWICTDHHCGRVLLEPNILYLLAVSVRAAKLER